MSIRCKLYEYECLTKGLRKDFLLYQMLSDAGGVILEGGLAIKKIEKVI